MRTRALTKMVGLIRASLLSLSFTLPTQAAELSPWMGSNEQTPFQLDPNTMVAVTFAADPLQTGSTSKLPCDPKTCATDMKAARSLKAARGTPQN